MGLAAASTVWGKRHLRPLFADRLPHDYWRLTRSTRAEAGLLTHPYNHQWKGWLCPIPSGGAPKSVFANSNPIGATAANNVDLQNQPILRQGEGATVICRFEPNTEARPSNASAATVFLHYCTALVAEPIRATRSNLLSSTRSCGRSWPATDGSATVKLAKLMPENPVDQRRIAVYGDADWQVVNR